MESNQNSKTEDRRPKTAVIGVGSLGQHHARNYAELAREGTGEFVGVCDVNEEKAREIAGKNDCEYFTDWRELLDKADAVSIVTPTETHAEIACEFLEKGVHVLVEKPIARTLEETDRMIASAQKTGAKLMVGHLERFNPAMVALRPHVTNPLYFEIHRVSPFPNRSLDVDVVLDVMIHDLDAIQWLVGEDVKVSEIRAVGIPVISDKVDAANARIEFENGAVANITAADYRGAVAIALGSEARGLSDAWATLARDSVHVPMMGVADSLNVSATAAVLFYEALRQRRSL